MKSRVVTAEVLDGLAPDNIDAMRSRRDLQRVHRAMGTRLIVANALRNISALDSQAPPLRVLELGAGDGTLMLGVARSLASAWPRVELTLLDRQALIPVAAKEHYAQLGWTIVERIQDVLDWAVEPIPSAPAQARWDLIIANLFLHHFDDRPLATLLVAIAARTQRFFACEPRRAWLPLVGSHLVGAIGANAVTRGDAVLSVHAGFRGNELSSFWPPGDTWLLREYSAGLFSHCFIAERRATV